MTVPNGSPTLASVEVRTVSRGGDVRRFVAFPRRIYGDDPYWVAPLPGQLRKRLDPARNPYYAGARRELFLAWQNGRVVGTVAAILPEAHNKLLGEKLGYFGFLEAEDDPAVVRALLERAARWLAAAGATTMRGPVNGSASDEIGVLVEGFNTRPGLWQGHHPRYYRRRLEELPFTKFYDVLAYELTYDDLDRNLDNLPDFLRKAAERQSWNPGVTVRSPTASSWAEDVAIAHRLYVDSHRTIAGHSGMSFAEFSSTTTSLRRVIDLDLTLMVEVDGRPVGFTVAVPDVNEALVACGNSRTLWTPVKLMRSLSTVRTVSIKLLSTLPEYRNRGLAGLLCMELARRVIARGYERCDMSLVSERNKPMISVLNRLGARIYRRYRVYEMPLDDGTIAAMT